MELFFCCSFLSVYLVVSPHLSEWTMYLMLINQKILPLPPLILHLQCVKCFLPEGTILLSLLYTQGLVVV